MQPDVSLHRSGTKTGFACLQCGGPIVLPPGRWFDKKAPYKFCSNSCRAKFRGNNRSGPPRRAPGPAATAISLKGWQTRRRAREQQQP